jgi:hypothetical protein
MAAAKPPFVTPTPQQKQPRRMTMTKRIGNKDEAQQRSKQEKKETKKTNIAREAIKQAVAKAKYRNQVKGRPPIEQGIAVL